MVSKVYDTVAIYAGAVPSDCTFKISIRQQVLRSWNYSCKQKLKVSHIFVDQSTGESLTERVNFRRMVKEARARSFDLVVLVGLRYFCRSQAELMAAKEFLKQASVRFHNAVNVEG